LKKIYLLLLVIVCLPAIAHSQSKTENQFLYWVRYQNQLYLSPQLYWNNEIDNRRFFKPDVQNQFIYHSRLHYKSGRWDYAGGLTFSWAFAQRPEIGYANTTTEIRPVVEVTHELPIQHWGLQNRIRIDNRFIENDNSGVWEDNTYTLRLRYRLQAKIPLGENDGNPVAILRFANEIMLNHHKNVFDQNRIYLTSDFILHKNLSLEAGYIYIYQQRFGREEFFTRHVLRLSLLHKIKLY
jgi:hypothetical protein